LANDFGDNYVNKPLLIQQASQAAANLAARTARVRRTNYPDRMPRGSGVTDRYFPWSHFHADLQQSPVTAPRLRIGEVQDFVENFSSYIKETENETITEHTITSNSCIVVVNSSVNGSEIRYRLRIEDSETSDDGIATSSTLDAQNIDIEITTSTGRVTKRRVYFNITR
jgi:hypothetical protein